MVLTHHIAPLLDILFSGTSKNYWNDLCVYVPELAACYKLPQMPKHHPEIYCHVHICQVIDNIAPERDINLSLAALFHDVGKKDAHKLVDKIDPVTGEQYKKISHAGHEFDSAKIVERYMKLIHSVGGDYDAVHEIVLNHMKAHSYLDGTLKRKIKREDFEKLPQFNKLMKLQVADTNAKRVGDVW